MVKNSWKKIMLIGVLAMVTILASACGSDGTEETEGGNPLNQCS